PILPTALVTYARPIDWSRLVTFRNFGGDAGGGVWPVSISTPYLFLLSLLLPAYTVTGFDGSAHTSEETVDAARNVPKGMLRAVFWSGLFGWLLLVAIVLAIPDLAQGAAQGGNVFVWTLDKVMPGPLKIV